MALHQRQIIREAVVAQLLGKTEAAERVFAMREVPLRRTELPAICVYTLEETVDPESQRSTPRRLLRTLQLAVEIVVQVTDGVDATIDALALEVEQQIDADPWFGGACMNTILASVQVGIDVQGERPVGRCLMSYAVTYETEAPEIASLPALDDLDTVHVEQDLSGNQAAADRAVDTIPIPIT